MAQVEQSMDKAAQRSLARKLRREWDMLPSSCRDGYSAAVFKLGRLAAQLLPEWMESDYIYFQHYLNSVCRMDWRIADAVSTMALTYYEIPALGIWEQIGYIKTAQAAQRTQEGQIRKLLEGGLNVLDVMTMI